MTANIRFENKDDGKDNWPHRRSLVASIIKDEAVHILGTQEGRKPQIQELGSLISPLKIIDSHRTWIEERMYPNLFFDPKVVQVIKSGDIWLSETPNVAGSKSFGSMFPRLATYAFMSLKENEAHYLLVNCHLDHLSESTRLKQAKVLTEQVIDLNSDKYPVILMGDFNSGPFDSVRKHLVSASLNLYDPWISQEKSEETSFHKFDGEDPTGQGKRIDWILLDNQQSVSSIELIKTQNAGRYPSDHFFVKANLEID
jgi:endonuclease/exonuclease/phosphatase family metal-dependent hydrolase